METADVVAQQLPELSTFLDSLPSADSEAGAIDRLQLLEHAKRALAAVQAEVTNAFVAQRQAQEQDARIPTSLQLKGIEAEVGLARGESPYVGAALTHTATALCTVLPHTFAALAEGRVSEYHARIVAEQTNHLTDAHRRAIDAAIAHRLGKASTSQLRKLVQGHAYRLEPEAAAQRAAQNQDRRGVSLDPAGDGKVYVTAELPTQQGLAVMDALTKLTDKRLAAKAKAAKAKGETDDEAHAAGAAPGEGESLSRDQTMADLFVELLTGQTTAEGVTAEVIVVMDDATLFGNHDLPAWIPGHGPLPSRMVKAWLADPAAATFLRRMYTRPTDGQLVALESRRRRFPKGIANMLLLRDDTCATPGCNSRIEDADHRQPWAAGGPTSWANATGLCKRCNQRKENRGWRYTGTIDELTVITPTGHRYTVGTRPPLAEFKHWNSDPPHRHPGAIDIAWPTAKITWLPAA
jgi:hypothetical protein